MWKSPDGRKIARLKRRAKTLKRRIEKQKSMEPAWYKSNEHLNSEVIAISKRIDQLKNLI